MGSPAPPMWATRPPDAPTVKNKDDLHNLSQDSGLSHSPTHLQAESPQLTIGQPIRHVDNLRPTQRIPKKEKQSTKWNFGSLFKRKPAGSECEPGEEDGKVRFLGRKKRGGSKKKLNTSVSAPPRSTADVPPPLPPKNTNVFQPTMQVRGGHPGKEAIFPHLKPDLKYPEPGARLENGGYYYDQRFGYVRAGSYYDQQINLMIHPGADVVSRSSRESTMSKERCSSGVHSMGQGSLGHSMPSGINEVSSNSSLDVRSWKDQKHVIKKQVETERNKLKDSSDDDDESSQSSRAHSLSRLYLGQNGSLASQGRTESNGSISRRTKAARTDRYLQRRSKEEEVLLRELEDNRHQVESRISAIHGHCQSPYIHTAHPPQPHNGHLKASHRSQSVDTHIHQEPPERPPLPRSPLAANPPPPPPRDPKKKLYLLSQNGRPVSYSFESINVTPTGMPPRVPNTTPANHLPVPPRLPLTSQFSSSDQHLAVVERVPGPGSLPQSPCHLPRPPSQYPPVSPAHAQQPVRGEVLTTPTSDPRPRSAQTFHSDTSALQNFVDHEPRSRRPITWINNSGKDSPLCDSDIWKEFEDSATQFWEPHKNRLNTQMLENKENTTNLDDSSREDSPLVTSVDCKSPNRDSAIVSSPLPNQDSNSCSSIEKSGKSSPSSISSKDSGCSEPPIVKKKLIVNQRNNVTRPLSAVLEKSESFDKESSPKGNPNNVIQEHNSAINEDNPGFSTKKRRSHFEEALNELEEICNDIAADEDLLDRAERRDLPTIHQELIWRGRESDNNLTEDTSVHNTSGEMAFSDIDNIMNWNTSSSFENLAPGFLTPSRARTPSNRRSGVIDKKLDDMCFRKLMAANKVPTTEANPLSRSDQSYLLLSPVLSPASSFATSLDNKATYSEDEPDTRTDDVMYRSIRDKNLANIEDPQPKFGIPLGLATGAANSDYLHAIPQGKYKSRFNAMRTPDLVMDDVAFRAHRKDGNITDPDHLGIVRDPNGLIVSAPVWPLPSQSGRISPVIFYPNKNDKNMQELSKNIAQIIKKQSSKSSGDLNDIDLNDPEVSDCLKYTMDIIQKEAGYPKGRKYMKNPRVKKQLRTGVRPDWSGKNVYQLLSGNLSEPENMHSQVSRDDTDTPANTKSKNGQKNDAPRSVGSMVNVLTDATPTPQATDMDSFKHEGVMNGAASAQHHATHQHTEHSPSTPSSQQHATEGNAEENAMEQRGGAQEQQQEKQSEGPEHEVSCNNDHAVSIAETEQDNSAQNTHEVIVQALLLEQPNIDPRYLDSPKKSFSLSSLMQLSPRETESCKNLSDGAEQDSLEQEIGEELIDVEIDLIQCDLQDEEDYINVADLKDCNDAAKLSDSEPPKPHGNEPPTLHENEPIKPQESEHTNLRKPKKPHDSEPTKSTDSETLNRGNSEPTQRRVSSTRPPSGETKLGGSLPRTPSSEAKRTVDVLGCLGEGKLSEKCSNGSGRRRRSSSGRRDTRHRRELSLGPGSSASDKMPEAASGSERSEADRRMARYKEERRRQLATQIASRLSSAASSSDEEESDKVSYTEYRRRRRRKEATPSSDGKTSTNGSLSCTKLHSSSLEKRSRLSPEHIYQSIGTEIGTPASVESRCLTIDPTDSGRSISPSSRRFVSREGSMESLGAPVISVRAPSIRSLSRERTNNQNDANDKTNRRKSLLNTSYSSEEVPGTGSTGSEGAGRVGRPSRLPPTGNNANNDIGLNGADGRDGLASPDIIKSVSTRITPPVSPHHCRVARDWSVERKTEHVISDPLIDKWPTRLKKNTDEADRRTRKFSDLSLPTSKVLNGASLPNGVNQVPNGANQTLNGANQPESPGSVLSPSTTSPNKPPIFPSPDRSSNGFKISLKRPQESPSFLRKDSKSDSDPPPFMREFANVVRRRSGHFNPDTEAPPRPTDLSPRPHSVYRMESPGWSRQSDPELSNRDKDKERRKSDFLSRYEDLTNKAAEAIRTVDTYARLDSSQSRSDINQAQSERDFLLVNEPVEDPLTPDVEFNEELVLKTCQDFLEDYDRKREGQSPDATPPRSAPALPATAPRSTPSLPATPPRSTSSLPVTPPRSTPTLPIPAPRLSLSGTPRAAGRPVSQLSLEDEQLLIAAQHKRFWEGNSEDPVTSSRETSEELMRAEPVMVREEPREEQLLSVRTRSSSLTIHDKRSPVLELKPILKKSSEDLVGSSQPPGASILKHRDDSLSSILKRRSGGEEGKSRSMEEGKTEHVRIRSPSPDSRNERVRIRSPSPDFSDPPRPILRSRNNSLCDDRATSPEIQSILKRRFSQDDMGMDDYRPSSPEHTTSILKRKSSFGSGSHSPEGVLQEGTKSILKKSSRNSSRTCSRSGSQEELDIDPDDSEDWSRSSRPKSILKKKPGSTDDELEDRTERPKSILKSRKSEESLSPGSEASLLPDTPTHSILREGTRPCNRQSVSVSDGEEVLVASVPMMSTSPPARASILKNKDDRPQHSILKRREKSASPCREGRLSPEPCPSRDSFISTQSTESSYKTADSEMEERGERSRSTEDRLRVSEDRVRGLEERTRFLEERASSLEEQGMRGRGERGITPARERGRRNQAGDIDISVDRSWRGSRHLTQPVTTKEIEVANIDRSPSPALAGGASNIGEDFYPAHGVSQLRSNSPETLADFRSRLASEPRKLPTTTCSKFIPTTSPFAVTSSGTVTTPLRSVTASTKPTVAFEDKDTGGAVTPSPRPTVAWEDRDIGGAVITPFRPTVAWKDKDTGGVVTTSHRPTVAWEDNDDGGSVTTSYRPTVAWEDKVPSLASASGSIPTPAQRQSISQSPPRSVSSPPPPRPSSNPPPLPSSSALFRLPSSPTRPRKLSSSPPPQYRSSSSPPPQYRPSSSPPPQYRPSSSPPPQYRSSSSPPPNHTPSSSPPSRSRPLSSPPRSRSPRQTSSSPPRSPSPTPGPVPKCSPPLRRRSSERNPSSWSPDEERIGGILKRETTTSSCEDIHGILKDSREFPCFPDCNEQKAPKKSILKHESFEADTVANNAPPTRGVLKKDPSYEAPPPDTESAASARIVSCSSSSEDIAKTFSDVIIDPIPGAGRRSAPETPVKKATGSRTPVIPRSSVKISADGDLASKLEKLTVDAENIKLRMSSSSSATRPADRSVSPPAGLAATDTKSTLTSSSKSPSSKLSPSSSKATLSPSSELPPPSSSSRPSRSPSHPRRSSRTSTSELPTAADFYAIYQQQVKGKRSPSPSVPLVVDGGTNARNSDERGSVRRRSASPQFRQGVDHWERAVEDNRRGRSQERRSDNKENEANNMPEKKEIKIQGGGIMDRLASLQKSGEEDWKRRSPKLKAECPELIINKEGSNDAPVLLRKNVGREMTIERPVSMVLNKPVVQDSRPTSLVDRLSKLTTAQNDWQKKVGAKDTSKFTVAGKMEHDKIIKSVKNGEPLDRKESVKQDTVVRKDRAVTPVRPERSPSERNTPKMAKFRGKSESSESSDEVKDTPPVRMRPVSCIVESGAPTNHSPFHRVGSFNKRVSLPETSAPVDLASAKTVSIPKQDNQHLDAFFQSSLATVEEQSVFTSSCDLDLVKGEPLLACPKTRARPKRTRGSRNPLRALAARDLPDSYRELNSGVAEREVRRINKEKIGKHSHLAVEALAGLASTEDFTNVQLRRGTAVPHQNMLPYRDLVLLQVKGRRFCQCRVVAPYPSSMNSGDCYILVTPAEVFNWQGRFSNVIERSRSAEVALSIYQKKDMGCKSASQVQTIEEDKLVQCSRENRKFWKVLTEKEEAGEVSEAGPPEEDEEYETAVVEAGCVYEVDVDNDELVPIPDGWGSAPKHSLLNPAKVLVFDFGSEVYVYNGKNAPFESRKAGTRLTQELWQAGWDYTGCTVNPAYGIKKDMKVDARPSWTILGRINSQMETIVFREKFIDWPDKTRVIGTKAGQKDRSDSEVKQISSWADLAGFSGREMSLWEVGDPDLELENSHLGRGRGYYDQKEMRQYEITTLGVKAWHVSENNVVELGEEWKSQFHSGDTYVVRWSYKVALTGRTLKGAPSKHLATGRNRCAYFFWQGSSSRLTEQGTSALMTVELDKERGPQVRVEQGNEPAAFLSLWGGCMVTHIGRRGEAVKEGWRMYIVRGEMEEETCLVEVECKVSSLRSRAALVLVNVGKSKVMTWAGNLAQSHHREMAEKAVEMLKASLPKEMGFGRTVGVSREKVGKEGSGFWEAVRGNSVGYSEMVKGDVAGTTPRLFGMTSVSGQFDVTEIVSPFRRMNVLNPMPFEQATLYKAEQPALFLLDCGSCLWLWQGWTPQDDGESDSPGITGSGEVRYNAERRAAMQTVLDYRHAQHGTPPPLARLVWAGYEPQVFINHFPTWSVRQDVSRINQEIVGHENLETVFQELSRTEYSWEELQQRPLPPGVDPARIHNYIKEELFLEKFKMTKSEFNACPHWKQTEMKKDHGLF